MTSVLDFCRREKIFHLLANLEVNNKGEASLCLFASKWLARSFSSRHVVWKKFSDIDVLWSNLHLLSFDISL